MTYRRQWPLCELSEMQEAAEIPVEAERESGEMESAQESLAEAEKSGSLGSMAAFQSLLQVQPSLAQLPMARFVCSKHESRCLNVYT